MRALLILILLPILGAAGAEARTCRGVELNGPEMLGTELVLTGCPGQPRLPLQLQSVTLPAGVELRGSELVGARAGTLLLGRAGNGDPVRVRIDGLTQAPGDDLFLYDLSYQWGSGADPSDQGWLPDGEWAPVCPERRKAIAGAGTWDHGARVSGPPGQASFACQGSAVAKCIERLGYRPWRTVKGVSLGPLHQACVRAVRADYCGDGVSLTRKGERVNFYDALGIQKDTADWTFEAEWTPEGARCVNDTRLLRAPQASNVKEYIQRKCPAKLSARKDQGRPCLGRGAALLWTEFDPASAR